LSVPRSHPSDAAFQLGADRPILACVARQRGVTLQPRTFHLPAAPTSACNATTQDGHVRVEAYAAVGRPDGGHRRKIASRRTRSVRPEPSSTVRHTRSESD
jgi:hypothetical protein